MRLTYFVELIEVAVDDGVVGETILRSRRQDDILGNLLARGDFGPLRIVGVHGTVVNRYRSAASLGRRDF